MSVLTFLKSVYHVKRHVFLDLMLIDDGPVSVKKDPRASRLTSQSPASVYSWLTGGSFRFSWLDAAESRGSIDRNARRCDTVRGRRSTELHESVFRWKVPKYRVHHLAVVLQRVGIQVEDGVARMGHRHREIQIAFDLAWNSLRGDRGGSKMTRECGRARVFSWWYSRRRNGT